MMSRSARRKASAFSKAMVAYRAAVDLSFRDVQKKLRKTPLTRNKAYKILRGEEPPSYDATEIIITKLNPPQNWANALRAGATVDRQASYEDYRKGQMKAEI